MSGHLCEGVATVVIVIAEIVENHHHNHQNSVADGENVKRCSSDILGLKMEFYEL